MAKTYLVLICALLAQQQVFASSNDSDITVVDENTFWDTESWGTCDTGSLQSPININTDDVMEDSDLDEDFVVSESFSSPVPMAVYHRSFNTYVLQNEGEDGPTISGGGMQEGNYMFLMLALFFGNPNSNTGSQHTVNENQYAGEVNIYFGDGSSVNASSKMVAWSVFIEISDESDDMESMSLKKLFENAKSLGAMGDSMDMNDEINLSELTHVGDEEKMKYFFHYSGSLVVPPCEEKVEWTVFEKPIYLRPDTYAMIFDTDENTVNDDVLMDNYRPPQPLNNRQIKKPRNGLSPLSMSSFIMLGPLIMILMD